MRWSHIKGRFLWGDGDPMNLDQYEPLPYMKRLVRQKDDALRSGIFIGSFMFAWVSALLFKHVQAVVTPAVHAFCMATMAVALGLYLCINRNRLRWLPVAFIGLFLMALAEFL